MNVTAIRAGIADNLATISGLQTYAFAPDKPEPPCAFVKPHDSPFLTRETMQKGYVRALFDVIVLVGRVVDDSAQDALDGYIATDGDLSVWSALETDKTCGGACDDLMVDSISEVGAFPVNDLLYLGGVWLVQVLATGTS